MPNALLENHTWVKTPLKVREQRMFNLDYEKFIEMVSDSKFQLTFKKLQFGKFWYTIKNIRNYL